MRTDNSLSLRNRGVVVCNDNIEYGKALIARCRVPERSARLSASTFWLAWDVFHQLNDWSTILQVSTTQLKIEELRARNNPDLRLAQYLHQHMATLKELDEAIRYASLPRVSIYDIPVPSDKNLRIFERISIQYEIYTTKFDDEEKTNYLPGFSKYIDILKRRFSSYKSVVGVLSEQTNTLTNLVYCLSPTIERLISGSKIN
jgi:hypothetical protein